MPYPTCHDMHLATTDRHGIGSDYCPRYRGIRPDRDEAASAPDARLHHAR